LSSDVGRTCANTESYSMIGGHLSFSQPETRSYSACADLPGECGSLRVRASQSRTFGSRDDCHTAPLGTLGLAFALRLDYTGTVRDAAATCEHGTQICCFAILRPNHRLWAWPLRARGPCAILRTLRHVIRIPSGSYAVLAPMCSIRPFQFAPRK
jgi:hypothetical protein